MSSEANTYFGGDISEITQIVERGFYILDINFPLEYERVTVSLTVLPIDEERVGECFRIVEDALMEKGYIAFLRKPQEYETNYLLIVVPFSPPGERAKIWSFISLAATTATVFLSGYLMAANPYFSLIFGKINPLIVALSFAVSLLGIIGLHELGHLVASKIHGVKADLPIFIPMVPPYGTLGAIIRQRTPPVDRKTLFDLGISGPLISFIMSIITSLIGLMLSKVYIGEIPGVPLYPPLLFAIFAQFLIEIPEVPPGTPLMIMLHPVAFAGWLGMVITAINLFPVGQLDGGHVTRAIFDSRKHQYISYAAVLILFLLKYYFFAIVAMFLAMARHPGPLNDVTTLDKKRKIAGIIVTLVIIVLCLPASL
ncbi:MAG: site-2 protease family protein [Candidatus Baldrarchaeia archaeon]